MELAVVRHAHASPDGAALDAEGRDQADRVARRLGRESWDVLYSAPCGCARETATVLGAALGLVPRDDDDLPAIIARHPGQRVVAVAEASTTRAFVAAVLDVPPSALDDGRPAALTRVRASRRGHLNLISLDDDLHLAAPVPQEEIA